MSSARCTVHKNDSLKWVRRSRRDTGYCSGVAGQPSAPSVSRVLRASWLASGLRLTFSPLLWCCRTPPSAPPMTGAPPLPWDIATPPPLHPRTSSCCSGEPSLPPPRQVRRCRPHGAHAAIFGTPCPLEYVG
jgi:hypothetical protein